MLYSSVFNTAHRRMTVASVLGSVFTSGALASALALAPSAAARAQVNGGTVTGVVIDATDRTPLTGAAVSGGGAGTTTDASGRYTLGGLRTGSVTVTASDPFYQPASATVGVTRRSGATADFALVRNWGAVSGSVVDSVTGAAVAGATVTVSDAGVPLSATTDAAGAFSFPRVPAGSTRTLSASASGYVTASQTLSVAAGTSASGVRFSLAKPVAPAPGGGITGPGSTIPWNGSSTYLYGVNYAWWNYGTDFGTGAWGKYTDWQSVAAHFAAMKTQGARVVRWWVFADGRYAPEFNAGGTVSGLDSAFLADVDRALQMAADNGVYLMPVVVDSGIWSAPSYSGSLQMGGRSALVTDPATQQSFLDNALKPLLQHVAASRHAGRVIAYDIVNEPESNMSAFWGGTKLSTGPVQTFVRRCAEYVRQYGGGAYSTVGSASPEYVGTWKGLGLDFYQVHYYPWMDFWGPGTGLPAYESLGLDRPCIVGEFPTVATSYGHNDTAVHSARWYVDAVRAKGYAGALAWSTNVTDNATNWGSFQPVFSAWGQTNSSLIGPR